MRKRTGKDGERERGVSGVNWVLGFSLLCISTRRGGVEAFQGGVVEGKQKKVCGKRAGTSQVVLGSQMPSKKKISKEAGNRNEDLDRYSRCRYLRGGGGENKSYRNPKSSRESSEPLCKGLVGKSNNFLQSSRTPI